VFRQPLLKTVILCAVFASLAFYAHIGGSFAKELVIEIAVLAILAISLDFVAGFGGMISLGHGAISGVGAYAFAASNVLYGASPAIAFIAAILCSAVFGTAIGAVTSRTRGIFFIMATLAFGQMAYVLVFDAKALGGDDGMPGISRLDLSAVGVDLQKSIQFAFFCLAMLALTYTLAAGLLRSGFGRTLCGLRENEGRMRALGVAAWEYKAAAFGISGAFAGISGALAAQHTMFVSPELLTWTLSGECLVVVILGGLGTLAGPVLGAAFLILLKHVSSAFTNYWHAIIGLSLIIAVISGGRGIYGGLETLIRCIRWPRETGGRHLRSAAAPEVRADA
jgi:branched-chain amino acid transport system permease protein